ncbi:MAG: prepilin-type N-terminal cleavage/methylation domain-containing protein [Burkholderiales bacterium]
MNMFSRKNRKGFTLIELIVVIAILAILAAIAIPSFIGVTENANNTVVLANARTLVSSINAYNTLVDTGSGGTKITSITASETGAATLKSALGTWWPGSLTTKDAALAMAKISITSDGAASIKEETASPSST